MISLKFRQYFTRDDLYQSSSRLVSSTSAQRFYEKKIEVKVLQVLRETVWQQWRIAQV